MPMLPEVSILCWDAVYNNPTISFWDMLPATSKFAATHILSQKSTHCNKIQPSNFGRHCSNMVSIPRPNNKCLLGIVMALDLPIFNQPLQAGKICPHAVVERKSTCQQQSLLMVPDAFAGPWWELRGSAGVERFVWTSENHLQHVLGSEQMG